MSQHSRGGSYGHKVQPLGFGSYRLWWMVDRYVTGSRLRFPTSYGRDTDRAGAERFARKWGCKVPAVER